MKGTTVVLKNDPLKASLGPKCKFGPAPEVPNGSQRVTGDLDSTSLPRFYDTLLPNDFNEPFDCIQTCYIDPPGFIALRGIDGSGISSPGMAGKCRQGKF